MLEFTLIAGLFWLSWRIRKAARKPQTSRLDVHVFVHYDGGPGERQPEALLRSEETGNSLPSGSDPRVVAFRPRRAA
jgi:hypothetical protein